MGRVMPPIDVNKAGMIDELAKRIKKGLTIVLVYANWCGHCHTYKPKFEELQANKNRAVETAAVESEFWDEAQKKLNIKNGAIEGYPSVIAVSPEGKVVNFRDSEGSMTNTVPDHNNMDYMKNIMENGIPGVNSKKTNQSESTTSQSEDDRWATGVTNSNMPTNMNSSPKLSEELIKNMSLAAKNESSLNLAEASQPPDESVDEIAPVINNKKNIDSLVYRPFGSAPGSASAQAPAPANAQQRGGDCGCRLPGFRGGSLYGLLTSVASEAATPALLLGTAAYLSKKKRKTMKTRKGKKSQGRK
jgi:thiol-disulfide isomerase/thioredoxin